MTWMLSGCESTMTVCQNENTNKIREPEAWAMLAPDKAIKQSDISKDKVLSQTTENNEKWKKDRAKVRYLQNYVKELLKSQAK